MPTSDELRLLQALPLELKVARTQQRIREWVDYWGKDHVCVSFSGGKDSTVLLHIVREMYGDDIPAVFVNTGLEYPEIQRHVRTFPNVTILIPEMNFRDVIMKYGYPVVGKEVSECIYESRKWYSNFVNVEREREREKERQTHAEETRKNGFQDRSKNCSELANSLFQNGLPVPFRVKRMTGLMAMRTKTKENIPKMSMFSHIKYRPLLDADFQVSHKCCDIMKKRPIHRFMKETEYHMIIGTLAEESLLRRNAWIRNGCNTFEGVNASCKPLSFWREQDILRYILENHLKIADVYGEIVFAGKDGQISMDENAELKCSGCQRTGCIFCAFGAHHELRFVTLAQTHPKQYAYCMNGGAYDPEDGYWKPTKEGLGMAHVFDEMNRLLPTKTGRPFIRYRPEGDEMERATKLAEEKKGKGEDGI